MKCNFKCNPKAGGWISSFFFVLIAGLILTAFNLAVGIAISIQIPFTDANFSAGGSIGKKEVVRFVLPNYLRSRIINQADFINHTSTLTIWKVEGIGMVVVGNQPEAPVIDFNLNAIK